MSMFSGPLARLRAQALANNPDATPTIMDESKDPMTVAPAALGNTLRQKVGLDDPVMSAFNRYREAFAPAKAPPVEVPQGNKVMDLRNLAAKRRQQLVQQITQYQPGDPRRQALLAQRAALEQEDSALSSIGSADRSADILARQEATDGTQLDPEGYKVHEATIARAVEPRERLRQILQQRKDDELNAQRQRDAEAGLVADTRALEGAMGVAKVEQVRAALRNNKIEEARRLMELEQLPKQFDANLTAITDDNKRKNKLTDANIASINAQNKLAQDKADRENKAAELDYQQKQFAFEQAKAAGASENELRPLRVAFEKAKMQREMRTAGVEDLLQQGQEAQELLKHPVLKQIVDNIGPLISRIGSGDASVEESDTLAQQAQALKSVIEKFPPDQQQQLKATLKAQFVTPVSQASGSDVGNFGASMLDIGKAGLTGGMWNLAEGNAPGWKLRRRAKLKPLLDVLE